MVDSLLCSTPLICIFPASKIWVSFCELKDTNFLWKVKTFVSLLQMWTSYGTTLTFILPFLLTSFVYLTAGMSVVLCQKQIIVLYMGSRMKRMNQPFSPLFLLGGGRVAVWPVACWFGTRQALIIHFLATYLTSFGTSELSWHCKDNIHRKWANPKFVYVI